MKDIFSAAISGMAAIGALMAAYEAADAAEQSAQAARISNELTSRQFEPAIVITGLLLNYTGFLEDEDIEIWELMDISAHNIGQTYTCIDAWRLDVYTKSGVQTFREEELMTLPINSTELIHLSPRIRKICNFAAIDGYAIQVTTIHGTHHGCLALIDTDRKGVYSRQLADGEQIPDSFPFTLGVEAERRL